MVYLSIHGMKWLFYSYQLFLVTVLLDNEHFHSLKLGSHEECDLYIVVSH